MPIDIPKQERCPFCNFIADRSRFATVAETEETLAFLPPRQNGHGGSDQQEKNGYFFYRNNVNSRHRWYFL